MASQTLTNLVRNSDNLRKELKKVQAACRQVALLNRKVTNMQIRYKRALKDEKRSLCYALRMSIATTDGVRSLYYEYADRKARYLYRVAKQQAMQREIRNSDEATEMMD